MLAEPMAVDVASRATMAAIGMSRVRTSSQEWPEPIAGAELGEVEYALARDDWSSGGR